MRRALGTAARSIASRAYAYSTVRSTVRRFGPGCWRTPRAIRKRVINTARLRRSALWTGSPERYHPLSLSTSPTLGHRAAARRHAIRSPFVAQLSGVTLVGPYATPVTTSGRVLLTPFRDQIGTLSRNAHPELEQFLAGSVGPAREMDAALVFSLVARLSSNYYHWLVDLLPQLQWVEASSAILGTRPAILIPTDGPSFQRASLAALGWGDRVIGWQADARPVRVRELLVCPTPGAQVVPSPSSLRWIRARLSDSHREAATNRTKLYLARPTTGWRSVANADEVERAMQDRGFTVIDPGARSFDEQRELFRSASVIVGQHGAGLANLLFAPHAEVIELCGSYGGAEYYAMASALGNPYRAVACPQRGDDLEVDVPSLLALLNDR